MTMGKRPAWGATAMIRISPVVAAVAVACLLSIASVASACEDVRVSPFPGFPPATIDHCYGADGWNYNRSLVSRHYGIYAAMASDAYVDDWAKQRAFRLDEKDMIGAGSREKTGWTRLPRPPAFSNGLGYDVYYNRRFPRPAVVVAFRGTDGLANMDTFSNGSWFFGWFFCDQYCLAEKEFAAILAAARSTLGEPFDVVATGHSLGGGLARHVAAMFPGVGVVTFNTSFVTDTTFARYTPPVAIRIYEKGEAFRAIDHGYRKLWLRPSSENTARDAQYTTDMTLATAFGVENVVREHSMENLAAGLLRSAVLCRAEKDAECRAEDAMSRLIYCRYIEDRRQQNDELVDETVCPRSARR